ncbi:hypothetical protein D3C85_970090 [compost metagenome]
MTRIDNLEYNLARSLLKIATLENASRYSMKGIIIEEFNDDTGIDRTKSSLFSMTSNKITSEPVNIAPIAVTGGTVTVSSSYSAESSALNVVDGNVNTANTFSASSGIVTRTFASTVQGITGVNVIFEKPAAAQSLTFTIDAMINGAWTEIGQYASHTSSLTAGKNKGEIRFEAVNTTEIRLRIVYGVDWIGLYEMEILQPIAEASVVSISEDVSVVPTKAMVISTTEVNAGATVKFYVSRDDGTTWTEVQNSILTDISSQPSGTKLRVKVYMNGFVAVENYALMWR